MQWRTEPPDVEKSSDDLWVGVKGQSNSEIARTPRNAFSGGFIAYQILSNSECYDMFSSSEALGAKVQCREGKNPDHQLRSQNYG